jgi:phosphocarrier protein HPr
MIAKKENNTLLLKKEHARGIFTVLNDKGLHTRPSTELVKCATRFKSNINLVHQDHEVNAKSLLGILTLAANRGSRIRVEAEGEDAQQAVDSLLELAKNKFYINY